MSCIKAVEVLSLENRDACMPSKTHRESFHSKKITFLKPVQAPDNCVKHEGKNGEVASFLHQLQHGANSWPEDKQIMPSAGDLL